MVLSRNRSDEGSCARFWNGGSRHRWRTEPSSRSIKARQNLSESYRRRRRNAGSQAAPNCLHKIVEILSMRTSPSRRNLREPSRFSRWRPWRFILNCGLRDDWFVDDRALTTMERCPLFQRMVLGCSGFARVWRVSAVDQRLQVDQRTMHLFGVGLQILRGASTFF